MPLATLEMGKDEAGNTLYKRSSSTIKFDVTYTLENSSKTLAAADIGNASFAIISSTSAPVRVANSALDTTSTSVFTETNATAIEGTQLLEIQPNTDLYIFSTDQTTVNVELYKAPGSFNV
jgi:hypothetical protein